MARILILIGAHLCTAPRPQKEAAALVEAGHDVEVAGVWFDESLAARDRAMIDGMPFRFTAAWDFRPLGILGNVRAAATRYARRRALERFEATGAFSPLLLGYGAPRLLAVARERRADLTIVHSEAGLWVADRLLDEGARVGVDFEDWFSQDLPAESRASRPVEELLRMERRLCRECPYVLATTRAMSEAMGRDFQAPPPIVVRNVFPKVGVPRVAGRDRATRAGVSLHWFSQTIGRGRGLETLLAALNMVTADIEVHLRGTLRDGDRLWLLAGVPASFASRVHLHPTVSNFELPHRIAEHDIGLALETNTIRNRDLTATNKMFQYMQGGLAVVATDTAGQREAMLEAPDAGILVPCDDAAALAAAIDRLASDAAFLAACKAGARRASDEVHCWESQKAAIVQAAERALAAKP